jgi:hypothetical protein
MGSIPRGISASRGAAVLGLSKYQTPLEVFQRIMEERKPGWNAAHGYTLPPEPDNAAMRWGTAFESSIIELAEREQGKRILNREYFVSVNGYGDVPFFERIFTDDRLSCYITCHIDGRYYDDLNISEGILHEGKTTSAFTFRDEWGQPGTDRIPQNYQAQVQHQTLCTGSLQAIVSVLVFPETPDNWEKMGWRIEPIEAGGTIDSHRLIKYVNKEANINDIYLPLQWADILHAMGYFHQYPVQANSGAQKLMAEVYSEFWHKNVLEETPPEPRNYEDIKRLFPEPKKTIIVPDYIERKIIEHAGITEETNNTKKRKERLKTIITKYAVEHIEGGILDDESTEAVIFRNASGDKLASYAKQKDGKLVFRT